MSHTSFYIQIFHLMPRILIILINKGKRYNEVKVRVEGV